jgi:hypothetical protein
MIFLKKKQHKHLKVNILQIQKRETIYNIIILYPQKPVNYNEQ